VQIGLIIIGTELMTGKRRDGHMAFAVEAFAQRHLELSWATYLGDDPPRLTATIRAALEAGDLVFSFGGIGATPDDHTRQCAALAANVTLERHAQAAAIIEERFGDDAYPQRIHMAHLPAGASLIPNPVNRIAGFSMGDVHFVPGFPQMAWPMLEWVLDTHYPNLGASEAPIEALFLLPGVSEGQLIDVMQTLVAAHPRVALSCLPHMDGDYRETELGLRGQQAEVEQASQALSAALDNDGFTWARRDG
jgi:molybdopterin-biosynthesis enzyme MoeA-like protein